MVCLPWGSWGWSLSDPFEWCFWTAAPAPEGLVPKQRREKEFSLCFFSSCFSLSAWCSAGRVLWKEVPLLWKNYTSMLNLCDKLQSSVCIGKCKTLWNWSRIKTVFQYLPSVPAHSKDRLWRPGLVQGYKWTGPHQRSSWGITISFEPSGWESQETKQIKAGIKKALLSFHG